MADYDSRSMNVKVTCYLEVISSWCYRAEPAWAELKQRYAQKPGGARTFLLAVKERKA
ncbi:MAG: hypothetical protein ACLQAH_18420 [Limisphaerales bacterium]